MTTYSRFIQIDEAGYFLVDKIRIADPNKGHDWMANVQIDARMRPFTIIDGDAVLIEAFDEPYIALKVARNAQIWTITILYGHEETFALEDLTVDDWDRFHGTTSRNIPFVFSRSAQAQLFDLFDEFDDESVTVDHKRYKIQPWLQDNSSSVGEEFWTNIYRTEEPGWELNGPSHVLPTIVPKLKLQRCRVLVAGAGSGNDAAWFAQQGHIVTAIDFSQEAIERARSKYGHIRDLKFLCSDIFDLPQDLTGAFDLVFEHTLYCAIAPSRRNDLIKVWRRALTDQGHIMGVFFAFEKKNGPPFGGSEWEIRQRLGKQFRTLYWNRLRDSRPNRLGTELFLYGQKLSVF